MAIVSIHEVRIQLSRLVDSAASGADVIITRRGRPVARLTRLGPPAREIRFGLLEGKVMVSDDFDGPLPDQGLVQFGGCIAAT